MRTILFVIGVPIKIIFSLFLFSLLTTSCLSDKKKPSELEKLNSHIHEVIYKESGDFTGAIYCYYIFQGVLNQKEITPALFAKYVKGSSLSLKYIGEYNQWLETTEGKDCKVLVGSKFKLVKPKKDKRYAIFLNTKAIIEEGKKIELTRNHERLHVAFAMYKEHQHKIKDAWNMLPSEEKNKFTSKHPGYNFKNERILLKEYFSYTFQGELEKGLEFLKH